MIVHMYLFACFSSTLRQVLIESLAGGGEGPYDTVARWVADFAESRFRALGFRV